VAQFWCTGCNQFFAEDGFCPFDGNRLTVPPEAITGPTDNGPLMMPNQPITMKAHSATGGDAAAAMAAYVPKPSEYDRLIGQTLDGRYIIERKIGEGGMGLVFAARHAVIEKPLAIKVLKREVARDAATIKRFVQEAKAASRIGHPSIVDVTDFGQTPDGLTYSVMEYVDGTTLSSAIKRSSPFTLARAVPIIAQLGRALGAAHDKGIVHRDLKPENIFLVNRDGRRDFVKIVDFGIAKVTPVDGQPLDGPRLTRAGAVFGTPEYMAPEQAAGRPDTDQRVDIYALGTILYEMLVGRVPHKADSMVRTLAMQMLDPIEPPTKVKPDLVITAELESVVMKALAKKRENRYTTMTDFVTDLERACPGIQTQVAAPSGGDAPLQLVAAPPGSDLAVMSAQPTIDDEQRRRTPGAVKKPSAPPRPRAPSASPSSHAPDTIDDHLEGPRATRKRVANEPAFVTAARPVTFEHVFDEAPAVARPRRRWPLVLVAVLLATGGGIALAMLLKDTPEPVTVIDAGTPPDATVIVMLTDGGLPAPLADARVIVDVPVDAGEPPIDGGRSPSRRDAGVPVKRDGGVPRELLTARGTVAIQVFTTPDNGIIYISDSYKGPSGVTVEMDPMAKAKIKCTLPGYDPGYVDVVFDGTRDAVSCHPVRPKRCVDNLHNPFDECPDPVTPD